jgi:thiol-disulfide isomerase/thioredoxin
VNDFIADHARLVLPLAAAFSGLLGTILLVAAWRSRRRPASALLAAAFGVAALFMSLRFVGIYRINRYDYELQDRTGINVSAFTIWTVHDGVQHQLSEFRGRPVLLYLWATFCGPCRPSLPVLAQLALALEGRAAVIVLSTEDRETLLRYSQRQAIPGVAAYTPEPLIPSGSAWAFPQAPRPTLFVIDEKGLVQKIMIGSRAGSYLRKLAENPRTL